MKKNWWYMDVYGIKMGSLFADRVNKDHLYIHNILKNIPQSKIKEDKKYIYIPIAKRYE